MCRECWNFKKTGSHTSILKKLNNLLVDSLQGSLPVYKQKIERKGEREPGKI